MATLVSTIFAPATLLPPAIATVPLGYTNALLVSKATGGEVAPEEVLAEWIAQAAVEIDSTSGMCFTTRNAREVLDGNEMAVIFLRCFPVVEILGVIVDGQELDPQDFILNSRTGSLRSCQGVWPEGCQNVEVEYIHGTRIVPPLVQKLATLLAAKTALSAKNGALIDSERIGDYSHTSSFKKLNDELDRAWAALGRRFPIDFI
jgi:hypothetical protein